MILGRLLILIAIIVAILWFLHWFRKTPPHRIAQVMRKAALWGLIALLLLAVLTGRLNPLFALLGAAIPVVLRIAHLLRMLPVLQQLFRTLGLGGIGGATHAGTGGKASSIRTRFLSMRLDHASGALDGQVLDGPFKGRRLSELAIDDLLRMLEFYRDSDAQSLAVLEAYLDREHGEDWRERVKGQSGAGPGAASDGPLTESEAWSILGLEPNAGPDEIRAAHRRLMQRLHPDRGGSDYLAAKINEAKRRLLERV